MYLIRCIKICIFSVSNAIVDQLLLDIDHVCSVSGEEDLSSLKKYVLIERGWLLADIEEWLHSLS